MNLRRKIKKWLYGSCPGLAGAFPYYDTTVYFPKGSHLFNLACEQGIYEGDNVQILQAFIRPDTFFFDIGSNIGLMAAVALKHEPSCSVVSFEPSPNVLPSLRRTIENNPHGNRWTLVPKAVGAKSGRVSFNMSEQTNSPFDGIRHTQRVAAVRQVEVDITSLDEAWHQLGSPRVSLIKVDVEGAELDVLHGAKECLKAERPAVLLEWNAINLAAYGCNKSSLLDFAKTEHFKLLSVPRLVELQFIENLDVHMRFTESFLLVPASAT